MIDPSWTNSLMPLVGPIEKKYPELSTHITNERKKKKKPESLYLIGSLRNEEVPSIARSLRELGIDVFEDWFAAGPEADDYWKKYEQDRGRSYQEALKGYAARHVFKFDKHHLDRCDAALLVLPAGKSGHLELGYVAGSGKSAYILLDEQDVRWDMMYLFADEVFLNEGEMIEYFS